MMHFKPTHTPIKLDALIIPLFENKKMGPFVSKFDTHCGGLISRVMESKDFEGKSNQMSLLYMDDTDVSRVLLVGLGKEQEVHVRKYKEAIGAGVLSLQNKKLSALGIVLPELLLKKLDVKKVVSDIVVACEIAAYAYDEHKSKQDAKTTEVKTIQLIGEFDTKLTRVVEVGIREGQIIADGVNFARHLGNIPPTVMTPSYLAQEAQKLSTVKTEIKTKVLSVPEITKLGMGCLLGVARGSTEKPKFIIVEYLGTTKDTKPSVLVGKGITFDSGGLSIKPGDYMIDMKFDMLGAASVLGIIKVAAGLKLKKNIVGLIPTAENMPGGDAYRPDDILTAMNGTTVEIKNTDAEGRLILADGLSYAHKYNPQEVIDLATLTGACMAALGLERSGLFTPEDAMAKKITTASDRVGEMLWRLPLGEEYRDAIKSEVADIKNLGGVGGERYGTASTAAAFLQVFTQDKEGKAYPWAHIDLASAIYGSKGKPWIRPGANGWGVQVMVEYLRG